MLACAPSPSPSIGPRALVGTAAPTRPPSIAPTLRTGGPSPNRRLPGAALGVRPPSPCSSRSSAEGMLKRKPSVAPNGPMTFRISSLSPPYRTRTSSLPPTPPPSRPLLHGPARPATSSRNPSPIHYAWMNPRVPPPPLPHREGEHLKTSNLVILRGKPRVGIICWEEAAAHSTVRAVEEMEDLLRKRFPRQWMHSQRDEVSKLVKGLMEVVLAVLAFTEQTEVGLKVSSTRETAFPCPRDNQMTQGASRRTGERDRGRKVLVVD